PPPDRPPPRAARRILQPLAEIAVEVPDAFFRLIARGLVGCGNVNRGPQEHLALAGMARFPPGLAIGGDVGLQLLERAQPNRDEHTMTELADLGEGIGAV